jgi:hypothetical protein
LSVNNNVWICSRDSAPIVFTNIAEVWEEGKKIHLVGYANQIVVRSM